MTTLQPPAGMAISLHAEIIDLTAPTSDVATSVPAAVKSQQQQAATNGASTRKQKRSDLDEATVFPDDSDNENSGTSPSKRARNYAAGSSRYHSRRTSPKPIRSVADHDDRQSRTGRASRYARENQIENTVVEGRHNSGAGPRSRSNHGTDLIAEPMTNGRYRSTSPRSSTRDRWSDAEGSRRGRRELDNDRSNNASSKNKDESSGLGMKRKSKSYAKEERNTGSGSSLFYIDIEPAEVPEELATAHASANGGGVSKDAVEGLLLPSHVSIQVEDIDGAGPEIPVYLPSPHSSDDEDFIQYIDRDEIQIGIRRYFDADSDDGKRKSLKVCKHCGAEGDHKTSACPVTICLTCGVHNEHSTRSCPISKTCFTCNMKGHISKDCPKRYSRSRHSDSDRLSMGCDRCGMDAHASRSCPTLWRQYDYVSDSRRNSILSERREKVSCAFGQGGEGYIGEDEWCYNCGSVGHLGDDCKVFKHPYDFPREPSAFSSYNTLSGPFTDDQYLRSNRHPPIKPHEWELDGNFDDGHGFAGPSDVGRRGRDKEREQMRKKEIQRGQEDTEDDWFSKNNGQRNGRGLSGARDGDHDRSVRASGSTKARGDDRMRVSGDASRRSTARVKNAPIRIELKKRLEGGQDGKQRRLLDRIALDVERLPPPSSKGRGDRIRNERDGERRGGHGKYGGSEGDRSRQQYFGGYN